MPNIEIVSIKQTTTGRVGQARAREEQQRWHKWRIRQMNRKKSKRMQHILRMFMFVGQYPNDTHTYTRSPSGKNALNYFIRAVLF